MYQYVFVKIEVRQKFISVVPEQNYQEVIHAYARNGWKFKQIFAPSNTSYGAPNYFELIFEKEV